MIPHDSEEQIIHPSHKYVCICIYYVLLLRFMSICYIVVTERVGGGVHVLHQLVALAAFLPAVVSNHV